MTPLASLIPTLPAAAFMLATGMAQGEPAQESPSPKAASRGYGSAPLSFHKAFNENGTHGQAAAGIPLSLLFLHTPREPIYMQTRGGGFVPVPVHGREVMAPILYPRQLVAFYRKSRSHDGNPVYQTVFAFPLAAGMRHPLAVLAYSPRASGFQAHQVDVAPSSFKPGEARILNLSGSNLNLILGSRSRLLGPGGTVAVGAARGERVPVRIVETSNARGRPRTIFHTVHKNKGRHRTLVAIYSEATASTSTERGGRQTSLRVFRRRL